MKLEELEDIKVSLERIGCALRDLEEVEVRMSNLEFDTLSEVTSDIFHRLAHMKNVLCKITEVRDSC